MTVNPNLLGGGYYALVGFLWIVAGLDYQSIVHESTIIRRGKEIPRGVTFLRLAFLVLWFMAAFRGLDVTNDTNAYWRTYQRIATYGFLGESRMEIGFVGLCYLLSRIFPNPQTGFRVLLFLSSTLSYFALEQWIEKHAKTYGVCILTFYFLLNASYMSAIRQSMAMGLVLLGLNQLEKKKYICFLVFVAIAVLFHSSAIVALAFIVFANKKYRRESVIAILGIAIIATATNFVSRIVYQFRSETAYAVGSVGNQTNVVAMSILFLSLILLRALAPSEVLEEKEDNDKAIGDDFYNYSIITTLAVTIMSLRAPALSRVCSYFTLAGIPYISNVMAEIRNRRLSFLIKIIFCVAIWGYSVVALILRPEWQHLWPYHFWWNS